MARFDSFSLANAPILLVKQTVKFAPECLAYFNEHGCFPEGRDARGDYMHLQFRLENGAETASWKEDKLERNPKFTDNLKLYYDGKYAGDGFQMKLTYQEMQKRSAKYRTYTMKDIFLDLLKQGKFDVWLYRYESKGRGYLQVAWNKEQYERLTKKKAVEKPKMVEVTTEEDLPFDI